MIGLHTGERLSFPRAVGRELVWLAGILFGPFGLVNQLFCTWDRPYQQCLHDKLSNSVTVRAEAS